MLLLLYCVVILLWYFVAITVVVWCYCWYSDITVVFCFYCCCCVVLLLWYCVVLVLCSVLWFEHDHHAWHGVRWAPTLVEQKLGGVVLIGAKPLHWYVFRLKGMGLWQYFLVGTITIHGRVVSIDM